MQVLSAALYARYDNCVTLLATWYELFVTHGAGPANDFSLNCGEAHGATCDAARGLPQLTKCRRAASASAVTPPLLETT